MPQTINIQIYYTPVVVCSECEGVEYFHKHELQYYCESCTEIVGVCPNGECFECKEVEPKAVAVCFDCDIPAKRVTYIACPHCGEAYDPTHRARCCPDCREAKNCDRDEHYHPSAYLKGAIPQDLDSEGYHTFGVPTDDLPAQLPKLTEVEVVTTPVDRRASAEKLGAYIDRQLTANPNWGKHPDNERMINTVKAEGVVLVNVMQEQEDEDDQNEEIGVITTD